MKPILQNAASAINKPLLLASLIVAASNVLSRILGFVRVQVLAYFGGTGPAVDAYSFSFTLPDMINHLLAGSALSITFIPIFQKLLFEKDEKAAWRFFSNLMTCGTLLFVLLIVLSMVFTREILSLAGSNINDPQNPEQLLLALRLTRIILPAQLFFFWGALLNGVQYAHKRFLIPNLTPLLYNLGIICGGWLLFPYIGIDGFSWGVLAGAFIGNVVTQIPGALRVGMRFRPFLDWKDKDLLRYVLMTLPLIVGLGMVFSNEFLFRVFGSYIPNGSGALASLDFSYKLMFILVALFGHSFAAGSYPFITQLLIEKKTAEVQQIINQILMRISAVLIPLTACLTALAPHVIAVLFQRGRFTTESTLLTAGAFAYYLPGAFFSAVILIVNRLFYALQNTLLPMLVSTGSVLLGLPLYYYLSRSMGVKGIALAASVTMLMQCAIMLLAWNKRHPNPDLKTFTFKFSVVVLVSLFGFLLCWNLKWLLLKYLAPGSSVFWYNLLICGSAGIPSLMVMALILEICKIQNYYSLIRVGILKMTQKK